MNWLKMVKMIYPVEEAKKKCVDKFGCTHHSYQDLNISWWVEFENYIFVLFWLKFLAAAMMMMMVFVGDNVVIFGVLNWASSWCTWRTYPSFQIRDLRIILIVRSQVSRKMMIHLSYRFLMAKIQTSRLC